MTEPVPSARMILEPVLVKYSAFVMVVVLFEPGVAPPWPIFKLEVLPLQVVTLRVEFDALN